MKLYYSSTKLPTRDSSLGYDTVYPSATVQWSAATIPELTASISLANYDSSSLKVYLGVYGLATLSSYNIEVTETTLAGSLSTGPTIVPFATAFNAQTITLTANEYYFMATELVTGATAGTGVTQRSGPGTRTTDITTDSAS